MSRDTKFGLLFVLVLTSTFGLLVYKRMHQPLGLVAGTQAEEPAADVAAGDDASLPPPAGEGEPALSLPPAAVPQVTTGSSSTPSAVADEDPFAVPVAVSKSAPTRPVAASRSFGAEVGAATSPALAMGTNSSSLRSTSSPAATTASSPRPALPTDLDEGDFFAPPKSAKQPPVTAAETGLSSPVMPSTSSTASVDPFDVPVQTPPPRTIPDERPAMTAAPATVDQDPFATEPEVEPATPPARTASLPVDDLPVLQAAPVVRDVPPTMTPPIDTPPATSATSQADIDPFEVPAARPTMPPANPSQSPDGPARETADPFAASDSPLPTVSKSPETPAGVSMAVPGAALSSPVEEDPIGVRESTTPANPMPVKVQPVETVSPLDPEPLPLEKQAVTPSRPVQDDPWGQNDVATPARVERSIPKDPLPAPTGFSPDVELGVGRIPVDPGMSRPVARPLAPMGDTYTIQPGENFWAVSKQVYGTGRYFQALARHNAATIPDPQRMKPGMVIQTPPAAELERLYPAESNPLPPAQEQVAAVPRPAVPKERPGFFIDPSGRPMYRVAESDTLSAIAKDHLGRSSRWVQIFQMNRQVLKDGNTLKPGTVLQLPADASQVQVVGSPPATR